MKWFGNKNAKYKRQHQLATVAILVFSLLFTPFTQAFSDMLGIFNRSTVHLSPEVHGNITLEGRPVAALKVSRSLFYGDDAEKTEYATTNDDGDFSFPEVNIQSGKPDSMFDESRIKQIIELVYKGEKYLLWYTAPLGTKPNQALSERLSKLNCDLSDGEQDIEFKSVEYPQAQHLIYSICRW